MSAGSGDVQARITSFWSTVAGDYEAHAGNVAAPGTPLHAAWVEAIRDALPPAPAGVLDAGTGTGFAARVAASLGHRVTAIDLADGMLNAARSAAIGERLEVAFTLGDAVAPDFPPAAFDVVMSRHLLWTLRDPDAALANWHRLLRPGGRLVAFDGLWVAARPEEGAEGEEAPGIFERHYTRETRAALPFMRLASPEPLIEVCRQAGFVDIKVTVAPALADPAGGDERTPYVLVARRN